MVTGVSLKHLLLNPIHRHNVWLHANRSLFLHLGSPICWGQCASLPPDSSRRAWKQHLLFSLAKKISYHQ